jgi:hypothetical protein
VPKFVADSAETTGLKWAAPAGGGKVLQVVSANYSTQTTNATSTYADTGLTLSITPTLASSKVLVLLHQNGIEKESDNSNNGVALRLLRASTEIQVLALRATFTASATTGVGTTLSTAYLDSPATTSATTYKTQFKNNHNGPTVIVQLDSVTSVITLLEIGA